MKVSANDLRHGPYYVTLDRQDISGLCVACDPEEGWADCLVTNEHGAVVLSDTGAFVVTRRYGVVTATRQEPAE